MKIKKIFTILLILTILINISTINAIENTTDILSENNENNIYVDTNYGNDNNTGKSWQTPLQTIEKAINLTNKNTITNIYLNNGTFTGEKNTNINITNNNILNIIGSTNTLIAGENKTNIFTITNNTKITLQNLQFTNSYTNNTLIEQTTLDLKNNKEVIIKNCQFTNNLCEENQNNTLTINAENNIKLTIENTIFTNNTLKRLINIENTEKLILKNNIISNITITINNFPPSNVNLNLIQLKNNTEIILQNNDITNISLTIKIPKIFFLDKTTHPFTISFMPEFEYLKEYWNTKLYWQRVLQSSIEYQIIKIENTKKVNLTLNTIQNNLATSGNILTINNTENIIFNNNIINNNTFKNYIQKEEWRGDYKNFNKNKGIIIENSNNLEMNKNIINNNYAENKENIMDETDFLKFENKEILEIKNVKNVKIENNTITNNEGIINTINNTKITITNNNISNNNNIIITNNYNSARIINLKGTILIQNTKKANITNNNLKNNFRTLYLQNTEKANITNNNFEKNTNPVYIENTTTTIENNLFTENTGLLILIQRSATLVRKSGGEEGCNYAIIEIRNSNTTINNSTFIKNKNSKGCIRNYGNLTLTNSKFEENIQTGGGYGSIISTSIKYRTDGNLGGDLHNQGYCTVTNTTFKNTKISAFRGGSIYNNGTLILNNTEISGMKSSQDSAGIHSVGSAIANLGKLTILDSIITNNTVGNTYNTRFQGTIHNEGILTARRTMFINNIVPRGGQLPSTKFIDAKSLDSGSGNIYNLGGTLDITECVFINSQQGILYSDIVDFGGTIINLNNNYWNGENPNTNRHTNINKINSYIILNVTPEYAGLNINETINITTKFLFNNQQELGDTYLPFEKLNLTFTTKVNGEVIEIIKTPENNSATFYFNWTQEKGTFPSNITYGMICKPLMTTFFPYNEVIIKDPRIPHEDVLIEVGKNKTQMDIEINNVIQGENLTIKINLTGNASHPPTGNITITLLNIIEYTYTASDKTKTNTISTKSLANKYYKTNITNGKAILTIPNLNAGSLTLKIVYEGDEDYFKAFNTTQININKKPVTLNVTIHEMYVGTPLVIDITRNPDNAEKSFGKIKIGAFTYTIAFSQETTHFERTNFPFNNKYGEYNVTITYFETAKYSQATYTGILKIKRYETNLTVNASDIMVGEDLLINMTVSPSDVGGEVNITLNNQELTPAYINGTTKTWTYNITNLKAGTYNITATFQGNNKYAPATVTETVTVHRYPSNLTVNMTVNDDLTGTITTNALGSGNITIWINNKNYTQKNNNTNTFQVKYDNGTNYIFIYYTGDEKYTYATWNTTQNLTYKYFLKAENKTYYKNEDFNYTITLLDGSLKPLQDYVNITFKNIIYKIKTDTHGIIEFPLKLPKGTYNITIQYNQSILNRVINITEADTYPEMTLTANNITYKETLTVQANITPEATGTITITVDGQTQTINIENHTVKATFENVSGGNQTINATYNGDNKYRIITTNKTINVAKIHSTITITTGNITFGENIVIYATTNNDATGNVTFEITNLYTPRNKTLENSVAEWWITPLKPGQYIIKATYNGDNNYYPSNTTYKLNIFPEINLQIDANDTEYAETLNIEVNVNKTLKGQINIQIDNINENITINNGKANLKINNLKVGQYTIKATYILDDYKSNTTTKNVSIIQTNPIKDIYIKDILTGEDEIINITLKNNNLKYLVKIDNQTYNTLNIIIPELSKGTHTLYIEVEGNENYTDTNQTIQFNAKTRTINITINTTNITYGEALKITTNISENATGTITYQIADQKITTENKTVKISDLPAGTYTLTVTYNGNTYYQSATTTTNITVYKAESTIQITTGEVIVGKNLYIYATTNPGTTGNVTFRIIGQYSPRNRTLEDNVATWYISPLNRGQYTITATYNGDNNYNPSSTTYLLAIDPEINLKINANNTEYGETLIIEASVDKTLDGEINIQIDNINENITINKGKAVLKVNNLTVGEHTIKATYIADNFQSESVEQNITINKTNPIQDIYIKDILAGEDETINITLKNNNLKYIIKIDNKTYNTLNIIIPELSKGTHTLYIEVKGNENYTDTNRTIEFNAKTQTSNITINTTNITYGEALKIIATVTENATGTITYQIGDKTITTENKNVEITGLEAGTYTLTVTYNGNTYYQSSTTSTNITVYKAESTIQITTGEIIVGKNLYIYATTNPGTTGNVTFRIIGQYSPRNRTLEDNVAEWYISPLNRGQYTIKATYNGDNNYKPSSTTYLLTIDPEINLQINANDTEYGEEVLIEVTVNKTLEGEINIQIDYINKNITINKGKTILKVTNLTVGEHTIKATYLAENFQSESVTKDIVINKANPIQDIYIKDILTGEDETINITLKNNNLKYIVKIDNQTYNSLNILIPKLTKGTHTLYIEVKGNENYTDTNQTIEFNAKTQTSNITIKTGNITYGESLKIKANITSNATGTITYKIADKTVTTENKTVEITDLPAGTYTLTVTYNGNSYYQSSTTSTNITVYKAESSISITTGEIIVGENIVIYATTTNGTTGNVTFRIIGQFSPRNRTLENNIAEWYISPLNRGQYTITATYNGDNNYNPSSTTYLLTIDPEINLQINANDTEYGETLIIEVSVNKTLKGVINIEIDDINENITINNGKALFKVNNLTIGTHTIKATFMAENFQSESVEQNVTIIKTNPIQNIYIKDILAGEDETINITLKNNDLKYIVKIDNQTYNTLNIFIPKLTKGSHTLYVEVKGNENYTDENQTVIFYAKTQTSSITINTDNITYGEILKIESTITANATGTITYKIGDKTVTTENKTVEISDLPAGNYTLTVTYNGNTYYQSSTTSTNIIVNKADPTLTLDVDAKTPEDPVNITVTINNDATGNITFRIYGVYSPRNRSIENGISNWLIEPLEDGEYTLIAIYNGDNNYNPANITKTININQIKTILTSELLINPDNSITIFANLTNELNETMTTTLTLSIANKFYKVKITNNTGLFTTPELEPGNYRYTLSYSGTVKYTSSTTTESFTIANIATLTSTNIVNDDDTATILIESTRINDNETVSLEINNRKYNITITNNSAVFTTEKLTPGYYNYTITYNNKNHTNAFIIKEETKITYTLEINPDNSITLKIKTNINQTNLTLTLNNKNYLIKINNYTGLFTTPVLYKGEYSYSLIHDGDNTHKNTTINGAFTIKYNAELNVKNLTKYYSSSDRLNMTLTLNNQPLANKNITITINGVKYTRTTDNNGFISMGINLNSGEYPTTVTFNDPDYNIINKKIMIKVKNTVEGDDIVKVYRNNTQYYAIFTDNTGKLLTNTTVSFNINGVFYNRTTNEYGIAKLNINLEQGTYILTAINPSTGEMKTNTVTVLSKIQENNDLEIYYRNGTGYRIKILDDTGKAASAGKEVTFNINGVFYTRTTDENGYVKLNINLQPGDYIITAECDGCRVSNNITVKPILFASNLNMRYNSKSQFKVTLLDGQGKLYPNQNVTFNINGVFYTRTSDEKGIAALNINLQQGKYIITSTYNDASISNNILIR